jgi:phosphoglycerate dehydrogenase-like enzyme
METAKRLKAFGMNVLAVNRSVKESPFVDRWYSLDQLEDPLAEADAVILDIALTEETRDLINRERLGKMKQGAVLINAARGDLVDEDALIAALDGGRLSGAALDVFRTEPLPQNSPLWHHPRVLISPHNSFVGDNNQTRLTNIVLNNLKAVIS